ncbi:MAG: 1-acyl-sn-glycerol-3-phosphate acyltransferase [Chitinophagales bacterium]|nr:1-acyl-sn-glycerol-3-phosphate acyltransferase [Chitinophagales bacterium]MCZ2393565.1 1-acyl-sn-glycerol-3-phosphate acyltransferase [Chitinophagales bacterium]
MLEPVISNIQDWPIARIARHQDEIIEDVSEESLNQIIHLTQQSKSIRDLIAQAVYLEKIRLKDDPWDVDPEDESEFWAKVKKRLSSYDPILTDKNEVQKIENDLLKLIIKRYTEEIIGNFDPKLYWFAQQTLPIFFGRLLSASSGGIKSIFKPKMALKDRLFITGPIEKIRQLSTKGTVILVPTHFSNLDSIIIGYGMTTIGLPAFQYGAGLNLFNSRILGYFMGNLGAYKLDRRKKNLIYIETLKAYSRINVYKGAHTIFFPGGTRSRAGSIEKDLKLGLVGTVIEAQRMHFEKEANDNAHKIFILPLTVSYHFVLEASSLISEHLKRTGKEQFIIADDPFQSARAIFKFFWELFSASSDITLSFSEPMDIFGNQVDDEGNSIDKFGNKIDIKSYFSRNGVIAKDSQREQVYTKMLGDIILKKFMTANTVYSSHMVAFVAFEILKKKFNETDIFTILRLTEEDREIPWDDFVFTCNRVRDELYQLNNHNKVKLAPHMTLEMEDIIEHGIRNVGLYHTLSPIYRTKEGNISSEDLKLLYFYHNRLEGYGLQKCI